MMSYMCSRSPRRCKICDGRWAVRKKTEEWRKKKGKKR